MVHKTHAMLSFTSMDQINFLFEHVMFMLGTPKSMPRVI